VPELPEVEALVAAVGERARGKRVARAQVVAFACLKTVEIPPSDLVGRVLTGAERHGKFLCFDLSGVWLVIHLAHAGWLTWRETAPAGPAAPGRGGLAFRLVFDDGSGFDLTEAGTQKSLAVHLVRRPGDVPRIATLGPEPLGDDFTPAELGRILDAAGGAQLKGVLRDQRLLAGVGNAYSDEIAWAARLSPFAACGRLDDAARERLYEAIRTVLGTAVAHLASVDVSRLRSERRADFLVHGRTGQPCPACGTPIEQVSFAESSLQYCPTCQTRGRPLADRRLSRLLK